MSSKTVFTTFETAKLCHVSPLSIINWVNAGRLSAFRTPGGHRRIRREDLLLFMRENGLPIPDELKQGSGQRRVLVIDDEGASRDLIAEHLGGRSEEPYEVKTAADGFEAGRLVAVFRPDVIVLDLRIAGLDGCQVCKTVKADPATAATVVVAMTGHHTPEVEARILDCGASLCLAKPIDAAALAESIDALLAPRPSARSRRSRGV